MVLRVAVEGFDAFLKECESLSASGRAAFVLFGGSKGADGRSWCPDCASAEPVVEGALCKAPDEAVLLEVAVGPRDSWKDPGCVFRRDPRTRLRALPTLTRLGGPQRLEEGQCADAELVEMLFSSS